MITIVTNETHIYDSGILIVNEDDTLKMTAHACFADFWYESVRYRNASLTLNVATNVSIDALVAFVQWMRTLGYKIQIVRAPAIKMLGYGMGAKSTELNNLHLRLHWQKTDDARFIFVGLQFMRFCSNECIFGKTTTLEELLSAAWAPSHSLVDHFPMYFQFEAVTMEMSLSHRERVLALAWFFNDFIRNWRWTRELRMQMCNADYRTSGIGVTLFWKFVHKNISRLSTCVTLDANTLIFHEEIKNDQPRYRPRDSRGRFIRASVIETQNTGAIT